jgi:hypothetical protein
MAKSRYSTDEIVSRGEEIYQTQLREKLEPEHIGKFLVIDIETGEYEMDEDDLTAALTAMSKKPDGVRFEMQIGYETSGNLWSIHKGVRQ